MAPSVPANRIRLPPYCWRSSERFSGFVAMGTIFAGFGCATVFVLIRGPRNLVHLIFEYLRHRKVSPSGSRSHVAIVIPQPNRRSGQIVFIAKRTETGGA